MRSLGVRVAGGVMGGGGFLKLLLLTVWATSEGKASPESTAHVFTIRHEQTSKCLGTDNAGIALADCVQMNNSLWKWVSNHRLFNLGSQQCLGLDVTKPQDPLKMSPCDSTLMLWWQCNGGSLYGASTYKLTEKNGSVTASFSSKDTWRWGSSTGNICELPYEVIYTRGGNSHGKPCEFPFRYKENLYHDCIRGLNETGEWCATTFNYNLDGKWGSCLKPVNGCDHTWEQNSVLQSCYQFNIQSSLAWKEAYISCQNQGSDLLSISSTAELQYIIGNKDLPDTVWIGLNRLDISSGWQWSDNTPLSFINWHQDIAGFSVLDGTSCGILSVDTGQWRSSHCETSLPYICKKKLNATYEITDWHYSETQCEPNWLPYNGYCYMLQQPSKWEDADLFCKKQHGDLISMYSLADIELAVTMFHNETEDIWSGFRNEDTPALFKWSDGSETLFTYWDQNEPYTPFNTTPNCVSFSGETGRWHVRSCNTTLKYICKKKGTVKNDTKSDAGCPQDQNWRRHGDVCYMVDKDEVLFGSKCNLTVTNKFEQEFLNSLIREHNKIEGKYFWISLRDANYLGDYSWETTEGKMDMTYANWNALQPAFPGGCVAMATGQSLGKWEVKDCKTFRAPSICKKSIGSAKPEVIPKPDGPCPDGWHSGSDLYCYKLFHYERLLSKRTWEEAEGFCEELGGHLPSFTHVEEMKAFYSLLRSMVSDKRWIWVGLNKRNLASHGSWQWSDNRPVSSVVLPHDFQEEDYGLRDCAAFKVNQPSWKGLWMFGLDEPRELDFYLKPFHCDATLEWVCQIPKGAVLKTPEWYIPDWRSVHGPHLIVEGDEFWFVSNKHLSHQQAALYCASNGSELASVESYTALKAIKNKLLNISGAEQKWWLKSINHYQSPLRHNFHGFLFKACWHISAQGWYTEYFRDIDCNLKLPFICENRNVSLLEKDTQRPKKFQGGCPTNWTAFGDKCFLQIPPKNVTFKEANEACNLYGATLPSISSQLEQDFVTYLHAKMVPKFWIGLKVAMNVRVNKWIDGSELLYSNFNPLLQGRFKKVLVDLFDEEKNQQCVFILNDPNSTFIGTWDFTTCADSQYVTLCQKYKDKGGNQTQAPVPEDVECQGHKYKMIHKNVTWYDALIECEKHNMQLVSITDQYQHAFLAVQVGLLGHSMWIGLSSQDDGVHYMWQDGRLVTVSRWSEDDQTHEECVYMETDGFWKTLDCDTQLSGAFCHFASNDTEKKPFENTKLCPHRIKETPWIPFRNSCYSFILTHNRWRSVKSQEARYVCRDLDPDAYVLNIRDQDENDFVVNQLQPFGDLVRWVWLGIIYDEVGSGFRWHDETYVKYSNWRLGRPDVKNNSFYAGVNLQGYWDMFPYLKSYEAVVFQQHTIVACKIEMEPNEEYKKPLPLNMAYENYTYHIIQKRLTWNQAVRECKKNGSHLASVHDEIQQLFLESIVRHDGFPLWIGLSSHDVNQSNLEWSDGSLYDYKPWEFAPSNSTGSCIYLDTQRIWKSKQCTEVLEGAICYKSLKAGGKMDINVPLCPNSRGTGQWVLEKDFCYGFDMSIYNFSVFTVDEANKFCQNLDPTSGLLTINGNEENAFVSKYLQADPFITNRVWLGLSPKSSDKELRWLDGSPVKYANWNSIEQDANGTCAVLLPTHGTWHKVACMPGHGRAVCKAPLKSNKTGIAIGFAVFIILTLIAGLIVYLYKNQRSYFFSSIRYQRTLDETENMVMNG
ncbi:LOW QUALITY PROTEIN: lymphocyte antigen 75 [Ascaphus truei]|uniref:LOW QUALITY PROTEIN: lymphocyte antigen 75 n=1 Tax=Ascaphus truei TaxID=8439 RepID=UPI003F5A3901